MKPFFHLLVYFFKHKTHHEDQSLSIGKKTKQNNDLRFNPASNKFISTHLRGQTVPDLVESDFFTTYKQQKL